MEIAQARLSPFMVYLVFGLAAALRLCCRSFVTGIPAGRPAYRVYRQFYRGIAVLCFVPVN